MSVDLTRWFPFEAEVAWMNARAKVTLVQYLCSGADLKIITAACSNRRPTFLRNFARPEVNSMKEKSCKSIVLLLMIPSVAIVCGLLVRNMSAETQVNARTANSNTWKPPRIANGHPDMQGVWTYYTLTPLQRPPRFQDKQFMSDDDAAEFEKQRRQANNSDVRGQTPEADLDGAGLNAFWFDLGTLAVINGRRPTSLIIDPPDGRLPPITAETENRRKAMAAAAQRSAGPEDYSLGERCLRGLDGPPMMPGFGNSLIQIVQTPDHFVIFQEGGHLARIVGFDQPHWPPAVRCAVQIRQRYWEQKRKSLAILNNFKELQNDTSRGCPN
jgi:hypothetical protein